MNANTLAILLNKEACVEIFHPISANILKVNEKIKITIIACDILLVGSRALRLSEYTLAGIMAAIDYIYPEFSHILRTERLRYFAKLNSVLN